MTREADMLAAEHALGLLTGDELREAAVRVQADPVFAEEVARWRGRLAPLHEEVEAVAAPTTLWNRIAAATGLAAPANDNAAGLQRRLTMWRAATGGMTVLAASLAIMLLSQPRSAQSPAAPQVEAGSRAPMVAMLGDQRAMKVVASWDPNARQLVLAVASDMPADPAHAHQLWVIPADGKPRSIGMMPPSKQMHMRLADALAALLQQGATIAISIEPPGGSPTGSPTGPVVASGALRTA
jgi:anti-sigma-K factor RskA